MHNLKNHIEKKNNVSRHIVTKFEEDKILIEKISVRENKNNGRF